MMHVKVALICALLAVGLAQNVPCYVSCKENACSANDLLACTDCDAGLVLLGSRCVPVGGQTVSSE